MRIKKLGALPIAVAVAASGLAFGSAASAGTTKVLANIGPVRGASDVRVDTKSKFILDSKGNAKVLLKGLCQATPEPAGGLAVCDTDTNGKPVKYNDDGIVTWSTTEGGTMDGDEMVAIIMADFESDPSGPVLPSEVQIILPCDIKKGNADKGCKVNLSELLGIQATLGSGPGFLNVESVDIYGPIGAAAATCEAATINFNGIFTSIQGIVLSDAIAVLQPSLAMIPVGDPAHPCAPAGVERVGTIGIGVGE